MWARVWYCGGEGQLSWSYAGQTRGLGEQSYLGFKMLTWPLLGEGVSTRGMGQDLSLIFKDIFSL